VDEELWFVQLPGGQLRAWDLDQLDAAFQHGFVDESTILRRDGTLHWQSLGELIKETDPTEQLTVKLRHRPLNSLAAYTLADRAGLPIDDCDPLALTTRLFVRRERALPMQRALVGVLIALVTVVCALVGTLAYRTAATLAEEAPTRMVHVPRTTHVLSVKREARDERADSPPEPPRKAAPRAIKRLKRTRSSAVASRDPITSGGARFDPLNGAL
jgi:hypothetical protein